MSKYCHLIMRELGRAGHATNNELLLQAQKEFPEVSATTIHRATARLCAHGHIASAPSDIDGAMRYDTTKEPHDHFMCDGCGRLRDVDIAEEVSNLLRQHLPDCDIAGRLTIHGTCKQCKP